MLLLNSIRDAMFTTFKQETDLYLVPSSLDQVLLQTREINKHTLDKTNEFTFVTENGTEIRRYPF